MVAEGPIEPGEQLGEVAGVGLSVCRQYRSDLWLNDGLAARVLGLAMPVPERVSERLAQ